MQISWWVELAVRPGCLDAFAALTGEMVASTHAERGVLAYQRFISDDQQTVHVHERYENSDAAMAHLVRFAPSSVTAMGAWSSASASSYWASRAMRCAPCWTPTEPAIIARWDRSDTGAE